MKQYSEWLDEEIVKKELTNNSFSPISAAAIGEYRKGRRFPKTEYHNKILDTLGIKMKKEKYLKYKNNFVRNGEM